MQTSKSIGCEKIKRSLLRRWEVFVAWFEYQFDVSMLFHSDVLEWKSKIKQDMWLISLGYSSSWIEMNFKCVVSHKIRVNI